MGFLQIGKVLEFTRYIHERIFEEINKDYTNNFWILNYNLQRKLFIKGGIVCI